MGLIEKTIPGTVVGCAEHIINNVAFVRFHFFMYLVNWIIATRLFDVFFVAFLDTLDSLFVIFEGLGCRSENR